MIRLQATVPALLLALLAGCATTSHPPAATPRPAAGDRTAVLLAINDVYRIEGVEGGTIGGLAHVRRLREELEKSYPDLLFLHGGDLLFPSFLSRSYNGAQMIDILNDMDGDPAKFDPRMFAVLGNHEFEKGKVTDAPLLVRRLAGSGFRWVNGNVDFASGADGVPLVKAANLDRSFLVESGGIRIGLFGLTVDVAKPDYVTGFRDPVATARELSADLRRRGAEVVVALTHLNWQTDLKVLETLGADGPDLIIGGHDHERMKREAGGRFVLKADADARTATVAHLTLHADGRLEVASEMRPLDDRTAKPDPFVQAEVRQWLHCHEREFCADAGSPHGCLEEIIGRTRTRLVAEESQIRSVETSLGDWVADRMLAAYSGCGAQAAFINSGTLRLNQDLPADAEITRRHVEELFGFPSPLLLLDLDGATLQKVVERSTQQWPGSGNWLQVAGLAFVHDTENGTASGLTLLTPSLHLVQPDEKVRIVTIDYVAAGGDGYTMLKGLTPVAGCAVGSKDLKLLVQEDLKAAEPQGIAPAENDGRICPAPPTAGCRALPKP